MTIRLRVPEFVVRWLWPDALRHAVGLAAPVYVKRSWSWGNDGDGVSVKFTVEHL